MELYPQHQSQTSVVINEDKASKLDFHMGGSPSTATKQADDKFMAGAHLGNQADSNSDFPGAGSDIMGGMESGTEVEQDSQVLDGG